MKPLTRKFGLFSLVPAMALAALFTACGDDSGSNGSEKDVITVTSDIKLADGNKVVCDEDMEGVVAITADDGYRKCHDGQWEEITKKKALAADKIIGQVDENPDDDEGLDEPGDTSDDENLGGEDGDENLDEGDGFTFPNCTSRKEGDTLKNPDDGKTYRCEDGEWVVVKKTGGSSSPDSSPSSSPASTGDPSDSKTAWQYLNPSKTYGEFLDTRDGQVYKTIVICDKNDKNCQTWMAQNLNYAPTNVSSMGSDAWSGCYDNESANCSKYGRLYTWEVAMDKAGCGYGTDCNNSYKGTQGVCPEGWHLPTNTDWQTLFTNVGGTNTAGKLLKANTSLWYENTGADSFGFAVLPAGGRYNFGDFFNEGGIAGFWGSTEYDNINASNWSFYYRNDYVASDWGIKDLAFSVRCLKDSPDQGGEATNPSSSSSAPTEDPNSKPAEVMPSGYYSDSEKCPAGLVCKYAATTEYLNSSKTYGEILDARDGQVYKTIEICDKNDENCQTWMAQNLNYGDVVSWCGGGSGSMEGDCSKYGRLYTWEVAMDKSGCGYGNDCDNSYEGTQGVCPSGWHLPSTAEWGTLFENVGGIITAGSELKSSSGWSSGNGTNSFGFAVLPAGYRHGGDFRDGGDGAYFWSSTENDSNNAVGWGFVYLGDDVGNIWEYKDYGFSVRCLRD